MPYLEDDPAIDYLDEPDPDAVPLGRDGKPLVPRPAAIAPPSLGAPPVAHPVGAGDQPTIREIIAQSQPQPPAISPDQQEMNGAVSAVKDAQAARAASLQSRPTTPEPKWWQRLAAGAAGAAAGYTNAAGRTHVDPSKAIAGIYGVPGQQRKMENWQKQYEGAQADTENAQQNLTTLQRIRAMQTAEQRAASDEEEKHARAQKESEANAMTERTRQAQQNERLEQAMLKPWGEDAQIQKEGEPVPQGMEVTQSLTQPGMVYVHPPRNVALTEDLAPYARGRKAGQMVPYSEFKMAEKRANDDLIKNTNKPTAEKENPDHWIAIANDPASTPEQVRFARAALKDKAAQAAAGRSVSYFNSPEGREGLDEAGKSLANYELSAMKDVAGRSAEQRTRIFAIARKYNPQFNSSEVDRRIKKQDYYDNGKGADSLRSFGTFLEHGGSAMDAANAINQTNSRIINQPINWWKKNGSGDPNFQAFMTALEPVRKEFEGFLLGGRALQGDDRHQAEIILNDNSGLAAIASALKQMGHTAKARFNEENYSYKRVLHHDLVDPFSPEAVDGARKLGVDLGAQQPSQQSSGPKVGDVVTVNGKRIKITILHPDGTFDGTPVK